VFIYIVVNFENNKEMYEI